MPLAPDVLVDAALRARLLEPAAAARLRQEVQRRHGDPVEAISRAGRCPADAVYRAVAEARGLPFVEAAALEPAPALVEKIPETVLRRKLALPLRADEAGVLVATADPDDAPTIQALARILGRPVRLAIAEPRALEAAVDRALRVGAGAGGGPAAEATEAANATRVLDDLLHEAFLRRASDIHLEPREGGLRVRVRVDGRLQDLGPALGAETATALVSRVKVLAGLDIAERRAPQDGGLRHPVPGAEDGRRIDIRVATAPTIHGERATLRLLGVETGELTLETLGFAPAALAAFRAAIRRPHGIVLLTGPTGSGKTTTLYAALREIGRPDINIVTVEDPVEYEIAGVSQLQVDAAGKVTFARALRSLLRHDPDVLMVGEIRDFETADVALKAAMTGHLVLSTLHASAAAGAVTRLVDLGCEPYLVGATLTLSIAQRLVRRLCARCKRARAMTAEEARLLGLDGAAPAAMVAEPIGCASCLGTGFRGRIGIFAGVAFDRDLGRLVAGGATEAEVERAAAERGHGGLRADGIEKVLAGVTSVEEVAHATVDG